MLAVVVIAAVGLSNFAGNCERYKYRRSWNLLLPLLPVLTSAIGSYRCGFSNRSILFSPRNSSRCHLPSGIWVIPYCP